MSNSKPHETREAYVQTDAPSVKPSYEALEDELIALYPKVDLLNLQLEKLRLTISTLYDATVIKGDRDFKSAVDAFNENVKLTNLTRLSIIALEAASTAAVLRNDVEVAKLLEIAVSSAKIANDHAKRYEENSGIRMQKKLVLVMHKRRRHFGEKMTDGPTDTLSRRLLEKIKSLTNEIEKLHLDVRDADARNKLIEELVNAITNDALTRSRDAELLALLAYVAARASHLSVCNKDDANCIQLAEKADAAAKAVYDFSVKTTKFDLEKQKMDDIRHYASDLSKSEVDGQNSQT